MASLVELRSRAHPNSMAWRKARFDPRVVEKALAHNRPAYYGATWETVDTVDYPQADDERRAA